MILLRSRGEAKRPVQKGTTHNATEHTYPQRSSQPCIRSCRGTEMITDAPPHRVRQSVTALTRALLNNQLVIRDQHLSPAYALSRVHNEARPTASRSLPRMDILLREHHRKTLPAQCIMTRVRSATSTSRQSLKNIYIMIHHLP
jgi:hypothetical protein